MILYTVVCGTYDVDAEGKLERNYKIIHTGLTIDKAKESARKNGVGHDFVDIEPMPIRIKP